MGFETGNILEPSMGVGNFFVLLPDSIFTFYHRIMEKLDAVLSFGIETFPSSRHQRSVDPILLSVA